MVKKICGKLTLILLFNHLETKKSLIVELNHIKDELNEKRLRIFGQYLGIPTMA